jgi:hypothetical protein
MSEQPGKKKGLSFAGVKAKIKEVPQGQLRVPPPPATAKMPSEEEVVAEDKRPVVVPIRVASGSRLLFGKKAAPGTKVNVAVVRPPSVPTATKVGPPPKQTANVLPPPKPTAAPVAKKRVQIVSEPEVRLISPLAKQPAVAKPKPNLKKKALLAIKAYFDFLKDTQEAADYESIDLTEIREEEPREDGRYFYTYVEDIDQDFTELNEEFASIEFTKQGFLIDEEDGDVYYADTIHLYKLFGEAEEEEKPSVVAVVTAATGAKAASMNALLADETFGELAEPILREEGRLPRETLEEKLEDKYTIPKPEQGYTPLNRRNFSEFIVQTFKPFELPALPAMTDPNACMSVLQADRSEMYLYQQFVKEYMSWQTPYRGILVYHGLGSGKTCTSIAAAEALFATANKKIIVMTPFSLRPNFIGEITTCGFHHFRLKNHWTAFPKSNPLVALFAKNVLGIPDEHMAKVSRIWIPDFNQKENFSSLKPAEQTEVKNQITATIVYDPKQGYYGRIWFVNYNGITKKELLKIACRRPDAFDNSVMIIDEIHNLIRVMQGTVEPYLVELGKKLKRKIDFEPVGFETWKPKMCPADWNAFEADKAAQKKIYKRGYLFYRLLTQAQNMKIIGLSGTPLINFPEELGILANVLHGYLQIVEGNVKKAAVSEKGSDAKDNEMVTKLKDILSNHPFVDFYDVQKLDTTIRFRITFLPEGIQKVEGQSGVERMPPGAKTYTFQERLESLEAALKAQNIPLIPASKEMMFKVNTQPLLPPIGSEFADTFLEKDMITLKNRLVLIKRLTGLVSYYKGSRKDLMPTVRKDETVLVPMSLYQQKKYSEARLEEIDIEEKKEKKKKEEGAVEGMGKLAALFAEVYEIKNMPQSSNYRMGSRQACNFVFPPDVHRPKPRTKEEKETEVGQDKEEIVDAPMGETEGLGANTRDEEEAANAVLNEDAEERELEFGDDEVEVEVEPDADVEDEEEVFNEDFYRQEAIDAEFDEVETEAYIQQMREEFEAEQAAKRAAKAAKTAAKATVTAEQRKCRAVRLPTETKYQQQIDRAKECLATTAKSKMLMAPTGLGETSPKYMKMLENIAAAPGPSLVYSQFLQMEGIGIFALAMEANGYEPIEINFSWQTKQAFFSKATKESLAKGPSDDPETAIKQLRYIKFTGAEENEVRKYSLLLFNGLFDQLPVEMSKVLRDAGWTGNNRGDLCRVFCITSAGAEGLSLKNVRAVHIMEPYWNDVRMAQVKGRAVRICSHAELPVEERTVDVFTYVSVFSPAAQKAREGDLRIAEKIVNRDSLTAQEATEAGLPLPPGAMQYTLTSDQRLWLISNRKKALIDNLQLAMKASAVDCKLNFNENDDKTFKCTTFLGAKVGDFMYDPDFPTDIEKTRLLMQGTTGPAPSGPSHPVTAVKPSVAAAAKLTVAAAKPTAPTPEAKPKRKMKKGPIGGVTYFFEEVLGASGVPEKYLLYAETNTEQKTPIGEVEAMESKKAPGTYAPKGSTLRLY